MAYSNAVKEHAREIYICGKYSSLGEVASKSGVSIGALRHWIQKHNWSVEKENVDRAIHRKSTEDFVAGAQKEILETNQRYKGMWNHVLSEVLTAFKRARDTGMGLTVSELDVYSKVIWRSQQGHGVTLGLTRMWELEEGRKPTRADDRQEFYHLTEQQITQEMHRLDAELANSLRDGSNSEADTASPRAATPTG